MTKWNKMAPFREHTWYQGHVSSVHAQRNNNNNNRDDDDDDEKESLFLPFLSFMYIKSKKGLKIFAHIKNTIEFANAPPFPSMDMCKKFIGRACRFRARPCVRPVTKSTDLQWEAYDVTFTNPIGMETTRVIMEINDVVEEEGVVEDKEEDDHKQEDASPPSPPPTPPRPIYSRPNTPGYRLAIAWSDYLHAAMQDRMNVLTVLTKSCLELDRALLYPKENVEAMDFFTKTMSEHHGSTTRAISSLRMQQMRAMPYWIEQHRKADVSSTAAASMPLEKEDKEENSYFSF
jgi:hypothetical protein